MIPFKEQATFCATKTDYYAFLSLFDNLFSIIFHFFLFVRARMCNRYLKILITILRGCVATTLTARMLSFNEQVTFCTTKIELIFFLLPVLTKVQENKIAVPQHGPQCGNFPNQMLFWCP